MQLIHTLIMDEKQFGEEGLSFVASTRAGELSSSTLLFVPADSSPALMETGSVAVKYWPNLKCNNMEINFKKKRVGQQKTDSP